MYFLAPRTQYQNLAIINLGLAYIKSIQVRERDHTNLITSSFLGLFNSRHSSVTLKSRLIHVGSKDMQAHIFLMKAETAVPIAGTTISLILEHGIQCTLVSK